MNITEENVHSYSLLDQLQVSRKSRGHCEVRILTVHAILCGAKPLKMKVFLFIQIENLFSL